MHDNYKAHHAQFVKDVLEANGIVEVEQPALSPDLQPIENFFSVFKSKLYARNRSFNTPRQLMAEMQKIISSMKASGELATLYKPLSLSMRDRMRAVIASTVQRSAVSRGHRAFHMN